jgi:exopolyphosphatase / guanosine-5'-triphosphate,3'-diphosphate pyrophosphatase
LEWKPRKKILRLKLTKASVPLYGEVAEARFASLAASLGAQTEVVIQR